VAKKDNQLIKRIEFEDNLKRQETEPPSTIRFEHLLTTSNNEIQYIVSKLESEKVKLRREIKEKEKLIRQKVWAHIFNNHQDITNLKGGDVFISKALGQEFVNKETVNE